MGKVGRPKKPKDQSLTPGFSVRFTPEEKKIIDAAVLKSGLKQSAWARKILLNAARSDNLVT
jgi:hypothetical protein